MKWVVPELSNKNDTKGNKNQNGASTLGPKQGVVRKIPTL